MRVYDQITKIFCYVDDFCLEFEKEVNYKDEKKAHVIYTCDYNIAWLTKYRIRILSGEIGK